LKTDLSSTAASKELIHERYKDLALVEWAFRTSKTVQLEMRPIYVRLASRTPRPCLGGDAGLPDYQGIGPVLARLGLNRAEGIKELDALCVTEIVLANDTRYHRIPQPRPLSQQLLEAAKVKLPQFCLVPLRRSSYTLNSQ